MNITKVNSLTQRILSIEDYIERLKRRLEELKDGRSFDNQFMLVVGENKRGATAIHFTREQIIAAVEMIILDETKQLNILEETLKKEAT